MTGRPRRVLILTASYGSGHNRVAQTLAEEFERAGASALVVDHFRDLVHPAFDNASRSLYYAILRQTPLLWGAAYWLGDQLSVSSPLLIGLNRLGMRKLRRLMLRERPDHVVSVHPTPVAALSELRARGHHDPIYFHGAIERLNQLYESFGVALGELRHTGGATKQEMAGHIVIAPPSALNDRWSRRLPDPVTAMASGWMRIRQRARQQNVELPLIISDHADWDELTMTIKELEPTEVWITHGREEALKHWCMTHQIKACELNLVGYEDEDD